MVSKDTSKSKDKDSKKKEELSDDQLKGVVGGALAGSTLKKVPGTPVGG